VSVSKLFLARPRTSVRAAGRCPTAWAAGGFGVWAAGCYAGVIPPPPPPRQQHHSHTHHFTLPPPRGGGPPPPSTSCALCWRLASEAMRQFVRRPDLCPAGCRPGRMSASAVRFLARPSGCRPGRLGEGVLQGESGKRSVRCQCITGGGKRHVPNHEVATWLVCSLCGVPGCSPRAALPCTSPGHCLVHGSVCSLVHLFLPLVVFKHVDRREDENRY
jgi:hypothetical protein